MPNDATPTEGANREAALREVLRLIGRSRSDPQPVFEAILESAAHLCSASTARLQLVNGSGSHFQLACNWGDHRGHVSPGREFPMDGPSEIATAIREARTISIADLMDTDLYRQGLDIRRQLVDDEGIRSWLVVPLLRDGTGIGSLTLSRHDVRPFTADEIALVEAFAEQAVIAIDNARQFREVQTRLDRERATREILQVISQSRDDTTPVFDVILENAVRLFGAPHALLMMCEESGARLELQAHNSISDSFVRLMKDYPIQLDNDNTYGARAVRHASVQHVADLAAPNDITTPAYQMQMAIADEGMRTLLTVPLLRGEKAIGVISLYTLDVAPFSPDQIALVETFAEQAVIAIENVRQFREVQDRLARETATKNILGVISRSRDDDWPVFDAILESARRLCNAPLAFMSLTDESGHFHVPCHQGATDEMARVWATMRVPVEASGLATAQAIRENRVLHVEDLSQRVSGAGDNARLAELLQLEGVRTYLVIPLVQGGRAIGTINLYRREVHPFSAEQIELVQTFAAQAVIAIENVRQFREIQTRLEREAATGEVLKVVGRSRDDERPVFEAIHRNVSRLCDAPFSGLFLVNPDGERLELVSLLGGSPEYAGASPRSWPLADVSAVARAVAKRAVIHIEDLRETDAYRNGHDLTVQAVDKEGIRTFLAVPLMKGETAVGSIGIYRQDVRPFSADQIELVKTFCAQAVIAIENVQQFKALEALNAELEDRVEMQIGEIERMGRLKRFLSPAVADAVISSGDETVLGSHRAMIAVMFCDIRGFTAFCESAEPEETIEVLQTYHREMGRLIAAHGGGVDHRWGDGIMVIFNDPLPCDDPAGDALRLAFAMRARMAELCADWRRMGHRLGFGIGLSLGYATVGMVGSDGRYEYTASGTAVNLAARLCEQAADGEILLSPRARVALEGQVEMESLGETSFKGIQAPVEVFRARSLPG